jgi:uncharacterized damage-inducible protein DinB
MRKALIFGAAALLIGGLAGVRPVIAQHDAMHSMDDADNRAAPNAAPKAAATPATPASAEAASATLPAMVWRQATAAQQKLVALAEAMPAEKYGWRPAEGVRSVGEVFMHVASANYFLPTFWGAKVPAGVDPRSFEKEGGDKAKTVATLKQSFDFLHQAIDAVPEADLKRAVQVFGHPATVGEVMLGVAVHAHEHLGQAIAYARSNGVVPPWSQKEAQRGR